MKEKAKSRSWSDWILFGKKNFPEYAHRIETEQKKARHCKFWYSFLSFCIPFLVFSAISTAIYAGRHYLPTTTQVALSQNINEIFLLQLALVFFAVGIAVSLICLMFGTFLGILRSKEHSFRAEALEIHIKLLWYTEKYILAKMPEIQEKIHEKEDHEPQI